MLLLRDKLLLQVAFIWFHLEIPAHSEVKKIFFFFLPAHSHRVIVQTESLSNICAICADVLSRSRLSACCSQAASLLSSEVMQFFT